MRNNLEQPSLHTLYKFCIQNIQNETSLLLGHNLYSSDKNYAGALCVAIADSYVEGNAYCEKLAAYWCALHGNNKHRYTVNQKKNFLQKQAAKWLGKMNHIHRLNKAPNAATKFSLIKLDHVVECKSDRYSQPQKLGTVLVKNDYTGKTFVSVYRCDPYNGWISTDFKTLSQLYISKKADDTVFDFLAHYAPKVLADTMLERAPLFDNLHTDYTYNSARAVKDYYTLLKIEVPPVVLEMVQDMKLSFTSAKHLIESSKSDEFKNSSVQLPEFEF